MLIERTSGLSLGILMVVAFVLWAAFRSGWMSGSTLGWMGAVVIGIVAVTLMAMRAGRPTRSVAHVLHDAEDQGRTRR
jgi:hypothetical protein